MSGVAERYGWFTAGTTVLFPQGAVHLRQNSGHEEMKVVCFFAPPTTLANYELHEGVDFPEDA
jgi:hypothetical protein